MEAPPLASDSFDVIVFGWSLYCLEDDRRKASALERTASLLKPGGSVYFVEANRRCYVQGRGLGCFWTEEEACRFFESRGFAIKEAVGWNPLPSLLFWLPWRLKNALPRKLIQWLYPPGRVVRFIPGWYEFFRWIGRFAFARKYCRAYFIRAEKASIERG
jgi:SAM-dependent methyltransferase